eukprot:EC849017.1.p2 GENE.EC849017.1~~EC849017.1.p2  ORF type:complete len:69 (-),score=17.10 EC849017.1:49-255(-)
MSILLLLLLCVYRVARKRLRLGGGSEIMVETKKKLTTIENLQANKSGEQRTETKKQRKKETKKNQGNN